MADPDLHIRGGGGPGHPEPVIRGGEGAGVQKNFFQPFRPQFGLKIRGGGGWVLQAPPLDQPLQKTQK